MRPTRRYWAAVSVVGVLAVGTVVLDDPVVLVGATVCGGWLLARQYAFTLALQDLRADLEVEQHLERDRVRAERPVAVTLAAVLGRPTTLDVRIDAGVPVAARSPGEPTLEIDSDGAERGVTTEVVFPVAGSYRFERPTVTVSDPAGLFEERFEHGSRPTLTVEPATLDIHVGRGGQQITRAFGERDSETQGTGIEPREIREYLPGDSARMIDWKATARQGTPYVRTFESETDWTTALVVDHRSSMARGEANATKLDFARNVALQVVDSAFRAGDPIGLYTVGDGEITRAIQPAETAQQHTRVKTMLHDLEPTTGSRASVEAEATERAMPSVATLAGDDSVFATEIRSFRDSTRAATRSTGRTDSPLRIAIEGYVSRLPGGTWTVIVTDDTNRSEIRDAVMAARRGERNVLVALTPTVLFENEGIDDAETIYERYNEFERFRRSLAEFERVDALEVAPRHRLASVVSVGRSRRVTA